MTTLSDIRDLECRLHSHFLEWSDEPLQNELLFVLDEMQEIHGELDKANVPTTGIDGIEMTLPQRIAWLTHSLRITHTTAEPARDFYGNPLPAEPWQLRLL